MRRFIAVCLTAAATVVPLAAPANAGATVVSFDFAGRLAEAAWTTCPAPAVGDICTDTVLITSDSALRERNTAEGFSERTSSDRVVLRQFVYEVVEDPEFGGLTTRPVLELFGGTTDATVTIQPRLRTATATAAVPMSVCWSPDDAVCAALEGTVIDVAAHWQADGELQRIDQRETFGDRTTRYRGYTQGWERRASATATLDGVPVPGVLVAEYTVLTSVRQGELQVYTGAPRP
ncbi:MAG TPA: hypothetical protein VEZ46_01590 [Mycobacteriales bacterium]|nr:hypothetical protein [Mycobacteriales bacterium]